MAPPAATRALPRLAASLPTVIDEESVIGDEFEAMPKGPTFGEGVVDPALVRKQVEYYLSDANLAHDKFFSEQMTFAGGWLDTDLILSSKRMREMQANKDDVIAALKASKLEVKEDGSAVRRPDNAPLPRLETQEEHDQRRRQKSAAHRHAHAHALHAHDGGAVVAFRGVPAGQGSAEVREELTKKLLWMVKPWYVSEVNDAGDCFVALPPFQEDVPKLEGLTLELGGAKVEGELCFGEELHSVLEHLPEDVRNKREKRARERQQDRDRPILIGGRTFPNVGALRTTVRKIISSRIDGESLDPDGSDFGLIKALLAYHPQGAKKSEGMIGLRVGQGKKGYGRCFFLVRRDMPDEDVSLKKCVDALEWDPPFADLGGAR